MCRVEKGFQLGDWIDRDSLFEWRRQLWACFLVMFGGKGVWFVFQKERVLNIISKRYGLHIWSVSCFLHGRSKFVIFHHPDFHLDHNCH